MGELIAFTFDNNEVRVIDSAQAARNLDEDEVHTLQNVQGITESRNGIVKLVNESGLYGLVQRRHHFT